MPAERLPIHQPRRGSSSEAACGTSERVIAQSLGLRRTAVGEYIRRVR